MELIRFELYYGGNAHDGGLVSCFDDILLAHDYDVCKQAFRKFNDELSVPPYYILGEDNRAFFTPQGFANFEYIVKRIIRVINYYCEGWEVREVRMEVPEAAVQYEDEFQKIVALDYYETATRKERVL